MVERKKSPRILGADFFDCLPCHVQDDGGETDEARLKKGYIFAVELRMVRFDCRVKMRPWRLGGTVRDVKISSTELEMSGVCW